MRPLKLTVEAFGPFAGKEIIDFTQIEDQQLFGIYGETGSGKSSIFEAIAFALFGKGLKKDLDDLRSDHSDMNTLCKVEFIFEASNNKYLVERSPKQSSETRKNIGAESYLFDITGIPLNDLSPTNRGRVLAEKKVSDTTEEIQNILGYGLEQFSQIVLLPQGEFEKFLLSTTDDKKKILGRLFDVSLYKNLAEKFAKDAKDVVEKKKALDQKREGQLSTQNLNTYEELEEKINEEKSKTKALKDRVSELKRDFDDIKKFKDKHEDLATKKSELSELMDKKPKFELIKQNIDILKNAEKLKPLHKDFKEKKSVHISFKEQLDTSVEKFEKNEREFASNKKQKDEIKALKDIYSEKDTERQRLKNYKVSLVNSQNKQEELRSYEGYIKTLSVYIDKKELEAQLTNVKAFEKKKLDFEEVEEGVRRLENSTKGLMRQLELAEDTYQKAEQNLSEMQAIHLSRKLVKGEACPVCGSLDHPKPAKGQAESKGLNDAFEDARKQKNKIKIKYDEEMGELAHQRARLEASKGSLAEAKTPSLSSAEIEIKISQLDFEETVEYEQLNIEQLKEERDKNKESKNQIKGSLDELIGDIPKELKNIEIVDLKIETLNTEIENYNERKISLDDKGQTLEKNKASLETAKKLLSENEENARRTLVAAEQKLLQGLEKYSFKDKDALEIYLPKVSQIKEEEKKWEEYDRAIERLEYDINTIKKSTEDIDQIGDEELKDKYTTALSSFEEAQNSLTDNETIVENLTKLKDKVDECDAEIKELEENHLSLINLSNAFNGREGSQRVGLETFALRKMFELVLAAANKRLNMMTRRYQLEIKSETKGAAQQGLDISVSDIFTGRTRSIQTLSGGETFMASLSLALGLSDIAQSSSKKNIRLDTIFIDEGFGSLDSENGFGTLGDVLNTLQDNIASSRAVGLVSHVDTVKNTVPAGFYIEKTPSGSHVKLMLE